MRAPFVLRRPLAFGTIIGAVALAVVSCTALQPTCAVAREARKALERDQVIELLESGVSPLRVGELARDYGVAFEMSEEVEAQLIDAGATEGLLKTLHELAPRPPPRPAGAALLLIEATPGGAQAYIDDEPVGTTSSQGRLKLSRLAPGTHRVRLSFPGYQDYEQSVELVTGKTVKVAANLQPFAGVSSSSNPLAARAGTASQPPPEMGSLGGSPNPLAGVQPAAAEVARFSVAHDHGSGGSDYCIGELLVGHGRIAFRSANGIHSFDFPLSDLKGAKRNAVYLALLGGFHIRFKKQGNYNFVALNAAGQPQPPDELLMAIAHAAGSE